MAKAKLETDYKDLSMRLYKQIADLEKENAELKGEADSVLDNWCRGNDPCPHLKKRDEQLIKAKEIIKDLMSYSVQLCDCRHTVDFEKTREEAEQFLSEVEK